MAKSRPIHHRLNIWIMVGLRFGAVWIVWVVAQQHRVLAFPMVTPISANLRGIFPPRCTGLPSTKLVCLATLQDQPTNDNDVAMDVNSQHCILATLEAQGISGKSKDTIIDNLRQVGLWEENNTSEDLILLAQDFVDRPEVFSALLISDFDFPPLVAHQTRALAMSLIRDKQENQARTALDNTDKKVVDDGGNMAIHASVNGSVDSTSPPSSLNSDDPPSKHPQEFKNTTEFVQRYSNQAFRSVIVNERQQKRISSTDDFAYGLKQDYAKTYPTLAAEIEDDFYKFMTKPSIVSQEDPIRPSTAKIYLRHARLFLGWCISNTEYEKEGGQSSMSIHKIIPNKEKDSANPIIDFVLWLRCRDVSVSYEANLLRGIIKLLKFRFSTESMSDPLDGKNTYDDIPIIREVRKLHRDANKRQKLAPRSSDEQKKWITWKEYLDVIESSKNELMALIDEYPQQPLPEDLPAYKKKATSGRRRRIADAYVRYLILAIFASIPDRQRTIRELEIGRTLVKDSTTGYWTIKHGPEDYKTGKHYGERPAIQLAEELTPSIDDFIEHWRPALAPSTNHLLVQSRTGKPLSSDSVFQRVVRSCFKYAGKRVNPHLLRDIIVTHVRETNASEKELEALALFMGHSIQMQRTSYDRRTLTSKIAPAIKLMESVNSRGPKRSEN